MPNVDTHTQAAAGLAGALNFGLAALFDISPELVLVVFVGSCIGLVFRPSLPEVTGNYKAFKQFMSEIGWLVIVTIMASWVVPWVLKFMPEVAQKTIAGGTGIAVMMYREKIEYFFTYAIPIFKRRSDK